MSSDGLVANRLLALAAQVPTFTWGRDEQQAGDMWNSNSVVAWLLARTGHDMQTIAPPPPGRAPGWSADLVLAERQATEAGPATQAGATAMPTTTMRR